MGADLTLVTIAVRPEQAVARSMPHVRMCNLSWFVPLTGNVRVTNFAAPVVPSILNPIRHIHKSNGRDALFAEKVGM